MRNNCGVEIRFTVVHEEVQPAGHLESQDLNHDEFGWKGKDWMVRFDLRSGLCVEVQLRGCRSCGAPTLTTFTHGVGW